MLKSLFEIGKYICEKEQKDPLTLSLKEQFENFEITREITIKLEAENENIKFVSVEKPIEIDKKNSEKYGILQTEKRGANIMLFYIFEGKEAKTIHKNRKKSSGKNIENIIVGFEDNIIKFFDNENKYKKVLLENYNNIKEALLSFDYSKDDKYLLTLSINGKYPDEIEEFKITLKDILHKKNIDKSNGKSFSAKKLCSFCNNKKKLVGYLNLNENFAFFNFAKKIFVRNYNNGNAYKNNGICEDCANYINCASHYINHNLRFFDKSINNEKKEFIVLPIFNNKESFYCLMNTIKEKFKKNNISNKNKDNINILEEIIADLDSKIQFNIMFISYKQNSQSREIIKYIQEVLPSHLAWILDINEKIEYKLRKEKKKDDLYFLPLATIWNIITHNDLFHNEKIKDYQYNEYLNFVSSIFNKNEKISYKFFQNLYNNYLIEIIQRHNDEQLKNVEFKILMLFYLNIFLLEINIFYDKYNKKEEYVIQNNFNLDELKRKFELEFSNANFVEQYWKQFKDYSDFYDSTEKCLAFLMGKLVAETKYIRKDKGSWLDGWLSNFSTNVYKFDQLLERCIETLSIEYALREKQNNILAIIGFFSSLTCIDKLEKNRDYLIFPFAKGFTFFYKNINKIKKDEFDMILDKLDDDENRKILSDNYTLNNEENVYKLKENLDEKIKEKILDLI
ncbi:MAG: TM1802 family CRISPR-associated protein [Elusimicrobiota bacterium]|jgi:hypothetical protein|nr:TM1802 family CRISPR-associated protein [Elusimicrobiota bacterium]